ncbi:hypothetical protein RI129_007879 [Pyrocoelia pectoralis]|uniref:TRUD domain-containing protein n=1 Tax=Pyrocoelia pectoralis TaxID=417401 RepID=A0AAN7VD59_9COLE
MSFRGNRRNFRNKHNSRGESSRRGNYTPRGFNKSGSNRQFFSKESFTESEVGITEYVSDHEGFSGVIKARFSDFHVNEINKSGQIAKLTDLSLPKDFQPVAPSDEVTDEDTSLLSLEIWEKLRELAKCEEEEEKHFEIDAGEFDKERRTRIHESIRRVFGNKIVAKSINDDNGKKVMSFKRNTNKGGGDNRFQWPKGLGEYVNFIVYKEAIDTVEATFKISDCLRMKSSLFTYAGVKDKRAKTTQWFCVKKVDPRKLLQRTKCLRYIHVGNITFTNEPLKLGHLSGNRFRIALRNVTAEDTIIDKALESLKTKGFINYYGLQRFGADKEVPTFKIGVALLKGNWKEACDIILNPKPSEDPTSEIAEAKRAYKETSDSKIASQKFNRFHNKCVESKLLLGFTKNHENDYVNALANIPRTVRLLYLHSFQSLVWNRVVSRRIKEFGFKPIVGDLVLLTEVDLAPAEVDELVPSIEESETEELTQTGTEVKVLTESDLSTYTIYDVVLPLPGYDITYPDNEVKNWYKEILEENGLTLEVSKQKVKTYNLSGTYRKILAQVKNLSWKTVKYDHPNDILIRSDYEELTGAEEQKRHSDGQYKGLCLDFCLDSSCYATMVLREILKIDTSASTQTKLNDYHTKTDVDESFPGTDSLLSDPAKYELFKQQIFATPSTDETKHKLSENGDNNEPLCKRQKTEEDASIKIQPSLV